MTMVKGLKPTEQGAYPWESPPTPREEALSPWANIPTEKREKTIWLPQLDLLSLAEEVFPSQQLDMTWQIGGFVFLGKQRGW